MKNEPTIEKIYSRISDIRMSLSGICKKSENDFIKLGDILKKSADVGEDIVNRSADFVAFIEGDSGKKALSIIKDLIRSSLHELIESRKRIVSRSETVNAVTSGLTELQTKNSDIETIARHLRAVALNIFIETARTAAATENFSIIANEVKQLSVKILSLSKTIQENVDVSGKRFSTLYKDIVTGIEKLEILTHDAGKSVETAVNQADEMIANASHVAAHAGDMGRVIFDQIGKIVVGLQFHDSMRQRIEHIDKGLTDMAELCRNNKSVPDSSSNENNLATLHAISSVLSLQLGQIIQESLENHTQNEKAFDLINQITFLLNQDIKLLVGENSAFSSQASFHSNATSLLTSALHDFMGLKNQGGGLVDQVESAYGLASETAESLSNQIGKIHEISLDAHIKSMNAIIAAMKLGSDGRTLSVLAGEMKTLSEQADVFVTHVGTIITNIVSGINNASLMTESSQDATEAHRTDLSVVIGNVPKAFDKVKRKAADMNALFENLDTILKSAFQGLSFMEALTAELRQQHAVLDDITDSLEMYKGDEEAVKMAHSMMSGRYTMEKERKIHKNITSADKSDIGHMDDNIELF